MGKITLQHRKQLHKGSGLAHLPLNREPPDGRLDLQPAHQDKKQHVQPLHGQTHGIPDQWRGDLHIPGSLSPF